MGIIERFEGFFGGGNKPGEEKYTGEMKVDPTTSEVVTPEEAEERLKRNLGSQDDWREQP